MPVREGYGAGEDRDPVAWGANTTNKLFHGRERFPLAKKLQHPVCHGAAVTSGHVDDAHFLM